MRAVEFRDKKIHIVDKPRPVPGPGEVLIKVRMAGICNTDNELLAGYKHFTGVPGHEFVGIVEEAPGNESWVGRRVVGDINIGCGSCHRCLSGDPRHCLTRTCIGIWERDGCFAEYLTLPAVNLHAVPDTLSDEEAVFAEPLAAALEPSRQIVMTEETRLLVLGDGKLGLLTALGLKRFCPGLILAGRHEDKLSIARAQGVATVMSADLPADESFDIVIEATGKPEGVNGALHYIRPEGALVLKTTTPHMSSVDMTWVVVNELQIIGSRCGDLGLALHFLRNKALDVLPIIETVYPFDRFLEAFDHSSRAGAKKVLLRFE